MDHTRADEQQAAVKYLLDELSAEERTEFEEHLFDCPICADQVRGNFTIVENLKEVLRGDPSTGATAGHIAAASRSYSWLRPSSFIPSFAALCFGAVLLYQNVSMNRSEVPEAEVVPPASLVATVARGGDTSIKVDRTKRDFLLSFGVDGSRPDSFICNFETAGGSPVVSVRTPMQTSASFTLTVLLANRLFPEGKYRLVLHPSSEPGSSTVFPFAIANTK